MQSYLSASLITCGLLLLSGTQVSAGQQPPPIDGVTGTVALESTVQHTYAGVHAVAVETVDGIEHLFHWTGRTAVHGGAAAPGGVLGGIDRGSSVVVHDTADRANTTANTADRPAANGRTASEGVVTMVDRRGKTIAVRFADGSLKTLRLIPRAASDAGKDGNDIGRAATGTATVVVDFSDRAGRHVARYFTQVS
jgi:hypothetical protein